MGVPHISANERESNRLSQTHRRSVLRKKVPLCHRSVTTAQLTLRDRRWPTTRLRSSDSPASDT